MVVDDYHPPDVPPKHLAAGATNATTVKRPATRRAHTAPSTVSSSSSNDTGKLPRPDWILTICYMLIYLELGWLVTLLWRSYGTSMGRVELPGD